MSLGRNRLWTVGSGRGGNGKSFLVAAMGAALAKEGRSTLVVDANLSSPNLHTFLGIKPPVVSLQDVLEQHSSPSEALTATADPNLRFVACAGDDPGMADLSPGRLERMAECISCFDAEYVIVDAGAGLSSCVLDFFNMGHEAIVVAIPEPESMQWAYGFIRNAIYRRVCRQFGSHEPIGAALQRMHQRAGASQPRTMMDFFESLRPAAAGLVESIAEMVDAFRPHLLINMAVSNQDLRMAEIIQSASKKFLNVDLRCCGLVLYDSALRRATLLKSLLDLLDSSGTPAIQIRQIVRSLAGSDICRDPAEPGPTSEPYPVVPTMGLNDNLDFMGRDLHVQTEDLGDAGHYITTNVFCDGRVILSTKSQYPASLREPQHSSQVVELMRTQHFNVIREIKSRKTKEPSTQA